MSPPLPKPTLAQRLQGFIAPFLMILVVIRNGFLPALRAQISSPSIKLLSIPAWWDHILSNGFGAILAQSDADSHAYKTKLISPAHGNVLEIGPGAGHNVKYYPEKVKKVIGVEPFEGLHGQLKAAIQAAGLARKYTIAPVSIEDDAALAKFGVSDGKFDTIVCVQCLCSCPNPRALIPKLQQWLKPGGTLIIYEHVFSDDSITNLWQILWTECAWSTLFAGCEMTRRTEDWLRALGGWKEINLSALPGETGGMLYPHCAGTLIKAN